MYGEQYNLKDQVKIDKGRKRSKDSDCYTGEKFL